MVDDGAVLDQWFVGADCLLYLFGGVVFEVVCQRDGVVWFERFDRVGVGVAVDEVERVVWDCVCVCCVVDLHDRVVLDEHFGDVRDAREAAGARRAVSGRCVRDDAAGWYAVGAGCVERHDWCVGVVEVGGCLQCHVDELAEVGFRDVDVRLVVEVGAFDQLACLDLAV